MARALTQDKEARKFAYRWKDRGNEKSDTQLFWTTLLHDVYGVDHPDEYINFEKRVKNQKTQTTNFIDGYIENTLVLIEQKDINVDLLKPKKQSDGTMLNAYGQAKRYSDNLKLSEKPEWIITCNFKEFYVYDMESLGEPFHITLEELAEKPFHLDFLTSKTNRHFAKEMKLSIQAGELVGTLYDAFLEQYKQVDIEESIMMQQLNKLCVRLVFCLYAEDAQLFNKHSQFHDYLERFDVRDTRRALLDLFKVLDTPEGQRDPFLDEELKAFPYVNGGLFRDAEKDLIPQFTDSLRTLLLDNASDDFDWSDISPTIFGAVFESTLNPETRRQGGMHYTSVENIHKVIDPLFLDNLKNEYRSILEVKREKIRFEKLRQFQHKLASLKFLDPACGSGNFLTESYLSIRRLENQVISTLNKNQQNILGFDDNYNPIEVSINQFYGIEINDFAVVVAKTALWIAESQMMDETADIVLMDLEFLPLTTNATIVEANALRIDWNDVLPYTECNYIMGNPPFVGQQLRTKSQSEDMISVFGKGSPETKLDYVLCWYKKAIKYMKDNNIFASFVSTSSICQGESVSTFWKNFVLDDHVEIQFAYTSFEWTSEANNKAMVYCVIIGFTNRSLSFDKTIYSENNLKKVNHINPYLLAGPDIWIVSRSNKNLNNLQKMTKGSEPADGGNLFLDGNEKEQLECKYPQLKQYIKPFIGGTEFLNGKLGEYSRFCFYLKNGNLSDFANIKEVSIRLNNIKKKREESSASRIKNMANYPYLFCQDRQPQTDYLVFPQHSTCKRKYIPIGFMSKDVVVGNACYVIPDVSPYEFGILTSSVHMSWMKVVCGRLGEAYRYSPAIYNNFPWPTRINEQKVKIENTAQAILDARSLYPNSSLADMYDPDNEWMYPELIKAHKENDKAVMEAYGFNLNMSESEIVAELFKMYQKLTESE